MATKKDALPEDWRKEAEKLLKVYACTPQALFTGRDPISRASLPSPDVHRREKDKKAIDALIRKSVQILKSVDHEAAAALFKAERRKRRRDGKDDTPGNDVPRGTWRQGIWCRALAYGILLVARLSMEQQAEGAWRISAKEARRTAEALRIVRRNAGRDLIQDHNAIEDEIKYFESSVHSARGRRESRTTQAITTLAWYHQKAVDNPVNVATAALIRASFGVDMTSDSVRSIVHRYLKKSKPDE